MKNFTYVNAPSKEAALNEMVKHDDYLVIAGGTDVMVNILARALNDRTLVDIRGIDEMKGIVDNGDTITIGALTTIAEILDSKLIEKDARCLWQAAASLADPTTRNSATIGGNIASASPGGDTLPALITLEAVVTIEKAGADTKELPITDVLVGPKKNCLEPGELITAITIKKAPVCCFIKLGLRNSMAISVASTAVVLEKDGDTIKNARVAMGSVAPTPVRCPNAEKAIVAAKNGEFKEGLIKALAKDIKPIDDFRATADYRKTVSPRLVDKAVKAALGCKGGAK